MQEKKRIWDLPTRLFHWCLVLSVCGAFITINLGGEWLTYHFWCGYAVVALISFRLIWGIIGPKHARFTQFIKGPKAVLKSLRNTHEYHAGHSPLGAISVVMMLVGFGAQALGGLFSNDDSYTEGPLAWHITKELSDTISSLHRQSEVWLLALIGLHILAIIFYKVVKRKNLVTPMITGDKSFNQLPPHAEESSDDWKTRVVALTVFSLICFAWFQLISWQPSFSY